MTGFRQRYLARHIQWVMAGMVLAPLAWSAPAAAQFEIYGFAQLDYIQDFDRVNPDWDATLRPSRIPTSNGQFGGDGQALFQRTAKPAGGAGQFARRG